MTSHDAAASIPASVKARARRYLGPVARRLGVTPEMLESLVGQRRRIDAQIEQVTRAQERIEAYVDRIQEMQDAREADLDGLLDAVRSLLAELRPDDGPAAAGAALAQRLHEGMLHADVRAAETRTRIDRDLADLRSTIRLTQALVDRLAVDGTPTGAGGAAAEPAAAPAPTDATAGGRAFDHAVPSMDLLYRAFEDHHRGDPAAILERQREDYLELLGGLPNETLPVADLGCGRGELVDLLSEAGHPALGVDANLGQIADSHAGDFVQDDLFAWLDAREDASCRAVVAMHVVEHLPADLQVRLVFEARRVLADGGALVLETPNTLSLNIAASNFWVDPTHERPVHPLFLEFLATEAGFSAVETRYLHPIPAAFPSTEETAELVENLNSLILGHGDLALVARR